LSTSPGLSPGRAIGIALTWFVVVAMALLLIWQAFAMWMLT
jgi:uncharacterized membrane protein YecN with MAPEG domain